MGRCGSRGHRTRSVFLFRLAAGQHQPPDHCERHRQHLRARFALVRSGPEGLNEQSGDRFVLGLGVSHIPFVEGVRQHEYGKPVATMRAYLQGMAAALCKSVPRAPQPKTVLAALGPKMLELSAELADGAHPYNVTAEHTRQAREILGAGKLLCVELGAVLESDATQRARSPASSSPCTWACPTT